MQRFPADQLLVSIIVPVFEQWEYTRACLQSIFEHTASMPIEVILADDRSTDETVNASRHFPTITVIRNTENVGFLRNCNRAARAARGKYLLFLNNDTVVQKDWLKHLVELVESDDRIGMIGAKLTYPDGTLQEAGGIIWNDASGRNYGRDDDPARPEYNYVKDVDYVSGACIMIRKDLWGAIGGFDERFAPAYYEDTDLAFTVREHGYRVVFHPRSVVTHFEGKSHGTDLASGIKRHQVRNQQVFYEKWRHVLERQHFANGEHLFWARDRSRGKKTLLFVDYQVPHYDAFAGSRTNSMYLGLLADMGLNVKLMGATFGRDEPYTSELERTGIEVLPGEVIYGDHAGDPSHRKRWQRWLSENAAYVDYVFLNKPDVAAVYIDFVKEHTRAKILYQVHDLHHLRLLRRYALERDEKLLEDSRRFEGLERDLVAKSDVVLTFSEHERELMRAWAPTKQIFTVPLFFYDSLPTIRSISAAPRVLFVGGFGHAPNIDAVTWFCRKVFPRVLEELPDAVFSVVGANPPAEVASLGSRHVRILGQVSDDELAALYRESAVAVVPVRYGAGVKGKVLEAMFFGTPLVSTSIGLEGLADIETTISACDDEEGFARAVLQLCHDEKGRTVLAQRCHAYLAAHFSTDRARRVMTEALSMSLTPQAEAAGERADGERRTRARLVAFYLPQFHPIPENDTWWGKGFTEWTNVTKARPLFPGHQQPRLPAELGFYDLRLGETRAAQAELAREHGIEAFCYWHYWFNGKRLIERPFNEVMSSGEPDLSFCLAWANETWSRRWLGEERDVLMAQTYSPEDDANHIRWLLPVLADPRCFTIDGRPLFLIYRPTDLPDPRRTTDLFRQETVRYGLKEPMLLGINSHCWDLDCRTIGFDGTLLFMPQLGNLPEFMNDEPSESKRARNRRFNVDSARLKLYDYEEALVSMLSNRQRYAHYVYPSIFVGWDNTPRRGENGIVIPNSDPEVFGKYLSALIDEVQTNRPDERMVFLNAWNEWAEGNHLEPDIWTGRGYLEEIRRINGVPAGTGKTSASLTPRRAAGRDVPSADAPRPAPATGAVVKPVRTVAFYLPQFHRIPENDAWWGRGFTEWRKVASARPLFVGHYQPHLPADSGFYDLRVAEARREHAELAREHGIDAFCYWHYWFDGRRLLEQPFEEVLASGEPDFPFCLCWANENWTRRWDGHDEEVLMAQRYSAEDDRRHLAYLAKAFRDPRYIRVDGRPLFLVYRAGRLPDPKQTARRFREEARRVGIGELFLCRVESFPEERGDPAAIGFDAAVEFQPDWSLLTKNLCSGPLRVLGPNGEIAGVTRAFDGDSICAVYDYASVVDRMIAKPPAPYPRFPCVVPMWDNSPRRGRIDNSVILQGSTPEHYARWLEAAMARAQAMPGEPLLFINAWNEWAEGNHLEPDLRHGRAYLEATHRAILQLGCRLESSSS